MCKTTISTRSITKFEYGPAVAFFKLTSRFGYYIKSGAYRLGILLYLLKKILKAYLERLASRTLYNFVTDGWTEREIKKKKKGVLAYDIPS